MSVAPETGLQAGCNVVMTRRGFRAISGAGTATKPFQEGRMKLNNKNQWCVSGFVLFICGAVTIFAGQKPQVSKWQPLNVKTGLWETTRTWTRTGVPPLPASMLERLTPEQLARIKASSAAKIRTVTDKNCVTKQDLEKPPNFTEDAQCTWSNLESTSTRAKGNVSCEKEGIKMTGNGDFEAPDQEHMNALIHLNTTGGGNSMTMTGNFKSRWLGPSCGTGK
jgi:uncharacterized protein DUF3617